MTDSEKAQLLKIIHTDVDKIRLKIEELKEFTGPIAPDDAIGRVSRMDAINNRSVFEASLRNMQMRLGQLEQTLQTISDSDFGLCTKCRQSIPFERLKIRPEIRLCANCMRK